MTRAKKFQPKDKYDGGERVIVPFIPHTITAQVSTGIIEKIMDVPSGNHIAYVRCDYGSLQSCCLPFRIKQLNRRREIKEEAQLAEMHLYRDEEEGECA